MPLPSQSARPISRRSNMHRRSGRRHGSRRWLAGFVVLLAAALLTWWMWPASSAGGSSGGSAARIPAPDPAVTGVDVIAEEPGSRPDLSPTAPSEAPANETGGGAQDAGSAASFETAGGPDPRTGDVPLDPASAPPAAVPAGALTRRPDPRDTPVRRPSAPSRSSLPRVQTGLDLIADDEPVQARRVLTDVLLSGSLGEAEAARVRERIAELNEELVFSPSVRPDDPFSIEYTIQPNDALSRIPKKMGLLIDWRLLQLVNRIDDPKRIRLDQRLKLVTGPFHAIVHKNAFRMDIYMGEPDDLVYVRSFDVGLGEFNSTPEGRFVVRSDSKLVNPAWRNPRTGQRYAPDDPANPIGERWIGLQGDEPHLLGINGYGIHGTIEPDSIGKQASMGCVRMRPYDVEFVYGMLIEGASRVEIRP